jgi:hypothetical protein
VKHWLLMWQNPLFGSSFYDSQPSLSEDWSHKLLRRLVLRLHNSVETVSLFHRQTIRWIKLY